jgi:hypothetical protein
MKKISKLIQKDYREILKYQDDPDNLDKLNPRNIVKFNPRITSRYRYYVPTKEDLQYLTYDTIKELNRLRYNVPLIIQGLINLKKFKKRSRIAINGVAYMLSLKDGGTKRVDNFLRPIFTDLWNNGNFSSEQLANIFGVSIPTIKRLSRRYGLEAKLSIHRPYIADIINKSRKLYINGWSTLQIGKKFGYNDETIRRWLKLKGVKLRGKENKNILLEFYGRKDQNLHRTLKPSQFNKRIKELVFQGKLMKEMEKELGMYREGIANRMKELGIYSVWQKRRKEYLKKKRKQEKSLRVIRNYWG